MIKTFATRKPTFLMSTLSCDSSTLGYDEKHLDWAYEDRYRVAWSINPHMKVGSTQFNLANNQHQNLKRALLTAGAQVVELPFVRSAYDSVFIKDNALISCRRNRNRALLGKFACPQRQKEQAFRRQAFEDMGIEDMVRSPYSLEGGDVVVLPQQQGAFLGYGFRSSIESYLEVSDFLEAPVTPLKLIDPYLYHLDTALFVLSDGSALACREAFCPESWERLVRHPSIQQIFEISYAMAKEFGVNLVEVNDSVIAGGENKELRQIIENTGRKMISVPLDQFQLAGGSAACLVAKIHNQDILTTRPTAAILSTSKYSGRESSSPKMSGSISQ